MIKRDANEAEIVKALRRIGCSVQLLHGNTQGTPDLLVGRNGRNYLLEVKGRKGKLEPSQVAWHGSWRGEVHVVRTEEDALRAVGLMAA